MDYLILAAFVAVEIIVIRRIERSARKGVIR